MEHEIGLTLSWNSLKCVRALQIISQFFGVVVPNLYEYKGVSVFYIIYSVFLCFLTLTVLSILSYIKLKDIYINVALTTKVVITYDAISLIFTNIILIIFPIFIKRKKMVYLVNHLHNLEKHINLRFQDKVIYDSKKLCLQLIIYIGFLFSIHIFGICLSLFKAAPANEHLYIFYFYYPFQNVMILATLQIHFYSSRIRSLYKFLHTNMYKSLHYHDLVLDVASTRIDVLCFFRKYEDLCNAILMVNDIYGFQIFTIICYVVFNIINITHMLIKFCIKVKIFHIGEQFSLLFLVVQIMYYALFVIVLSISCGNTSIEAKKVSNISYKLLFTFISNPISLKHYKNIKEELLILVEHIHGMKINFSTGFFRINYNTLLLVVGYVATNLIILLQFH